MSTLREIWFVVLRIIGYLSIAVVLASAVIMVRTLRRERRVKVWPVLLPLVVTPLILVLYVSLLRVTVHSWLSWLLLAAGVALGIAWSRTTTISVRKGIAHARRSPWYLLVWGLTFSYTQLAALLGSGALASYGLATVYLSTGLAVGTNAGILVMRQAALASAGKAPVTAAVTKAAGTPPPGAPPRPSAPATGDACPACGRSVRAGQRFCAGCGRALSG